MKEVKQESTKGGTVIRVVWAVISGIFLLILEHNGVFENIYNGWFRRPNMAYVVEDGYEVIKNSFELKDGVVVLHPQLIVQNGETIVRIIGLDGIYENEKINYEKDIMGFKIENSGWNYVDDLADIIRNKLENELSESQMSEIEIKKIILIRLTYHNQESAASKTEFYKVENGMVDMLTREETEQRLTEYDVNIRNVSDWQGTEQVKTIVEDCLLGIANNL